MPAGIRGLGKRILIVAVAVLAVLAIAVAAVATPTLESAPSISGTAKVGATLNLTQGGYTTGEPGGVTIQDSWRRCDTAESDPTGCAEAQGGGSSYQVAPADLGKFIAVLETASDGVGDPLARPSNAIGPMQAADAPPAKTADPVVSAPDLLFDATPPTATVQPGTWTGNPSPTVTDHWQRCETAGGPCADIGPTGGSYGLQAGDVGKFLRVRETATNGVAPDGETFSNVVGPVTQPLAPATPPAIDVTAPVVPQTITVTSTGTWNGFPQPTSSSYAWQRCDDAGGNGCVGVGGNSAGYATVADDAGKFIRVQVTASNGQTSAPSVWVVTQQVRRAPVSTAPPALNQAAPVLPSAVAGQPAPAAVAIGVVQPPGTWAGFPASFTYAYQWQRCPANDPATCVDVDGATGETYTLQQADVGVFLRVKVTASNDVAPVAGAPEPVAFSALSQPVRQAPSNTGADGMALPSVALAGEAPVRGETLTGNAGVWFAFPAPPAAGFLLQWQRCNAARAEGSCVDVGPAAQTAPQTAPPFTHTGTAQYVVTDADLGSSFRLKVTVAVPNVGQPVTLFSPITQPARGAPVNRADLGGGAVGLSDAGTPAGTPDGKPLRGETMTATSGLWAGFWAAGQPPLAITHTWQRCPADGNEAGCVDVAAPLATPISPAGATTCTAPGGFGPPPATSSCGSASVFLLTDADLGSRLRVLVTVQNPGGTVVVPTAMTPVVLGPPILEGSEPELLPKITGDARENLTLVASAGSWSAFPKDALTYGFEWLRCTGASLDSCSAIPGATRDTYSLGGADVGRTVRVRVTAKNGVLPDGVAVSQPTATVTAAPAGGGGGPGADMILQLSTATSGAEVTWRLSVRNIGTVAAEGVIVKATPAPQFSLVSAAASQGSCGGTTCSLGTVPPGGTATVELTARASATGTFGFTAAVSSSTADVNTSNNTVSSAARVTVASQRGPTANPATPGSPNGPGGDGQVTPTGDKLVEAKLVAKKVGKTWVVNTKFSLVSGRAKLLMTVTRNGATKPLGLLKGSRLGKAVAKRTVRSLALDAPKPATFPVRVVLPAKGFLRKAIYVIRIKATAPNGLSSTLDIGFSGTKIVGRSTVAAKVRAKRAGGNWVVTSRSGKVPAKGRLQVWVTQNGTFARPLPLAAGTRVGSLRVRTGQRQVVVRVGKATRLPVTVLVPAKALSPARTYVLRMRTLGKAGPVAQVDVGFRTRPAVAARASTSR